LELHCVLRFLCSRALVLVTHHHPKPLCVPAPLLVTAMDRRPSSIAACGQWRPPLLAAPPDLRPVGSSGDGSLCRSHYCSLAFFGLLFSVIQNVHANRAIYIWGQVVFLPAMIFHAPFLFSPSPPSDTQSEEHNKDPTRTFRVQTRFSSGEVRGSLW